MSLNWQADKNTPNDLLTLRWRFNGKESESMHPVLHHLIFLTMRLGCDFTKDREGVLKRIKLLRKTHPDLVTISYGDEAEKVEMFHNGKWVKFLDYYPRADARYENVSRGVRRIVGWDVPIDADWVDRYWGLSTNADRKPFSKWSAALVKEVSR